MGGGGQQDLARQHCQTLLDRTRSDELVSIDILAIGDYVKGDLFYRTVYLWDKGMLSRDEALYKDFLEKCRGLVANGLLLTVNDDDATKYMDILWGKMVEKDLYNKWFGSKRSNGYQSIMNRFMSKYT